jgi:hypothetical protein
MTSSSLKAALLASIALALPVTTVAGTSTARADDDPREEVEVAGTCGRGASSKLRLRADDGQIKARFEVDHNRAGATWRVVLVQERRVVWRGNARTRGRSGSLEIERRVRDLPGADQVTARAFGPRGITCRASATLAG